MLKSCWDCIVGYSREQTDNEVVYGTQLNGDSLKAPPWPEPQEDKEIMFVLPRKLGSGDKINISGTLRSNRKLFTLNLITGSNSPDYGNIACQFEAKFPESNEDKIEIKIIQNGAVEVVRGDHEDTRATDLFPGDGFTFSLTLRIVNYDTPILDIFADGSFIQQLPLKHYISNIRFLTLNGDVDKVDKLDFEFANQ